MMVFDVYVYDQGNKLLGSSTKFGTTTEVVIYNSTARKATYYIKVMGKNGAFSASYCYSLQALFSNLPSSSSIKVATQIELMEDVESKSLYPNPATTFVILPFNSIVEGPANVQIMNTAGQLIKQSAIKINKGYNQVKVSVNDINEGIYLMKINTDELNMIKKFVIAR